MEIGFNTVLYLTISLILVPIIFLKPRSIIYLFIAVSMYPVFFRKQVSFGSVNLYSEDIILLFYVLLSVTLILNNYIKREHIFNVPSKSKDLVILVSLYIIMHIMHSLYAMIQGVPLQNAIRRFLDYSGCLYFFFPILFFKNLKQYRCLLVFCATMAIIAPVWQIYTFKALKAWEQSITSSGTIRLGIGGLSIIGCGLFSITSFTNEVKYYLLSVNPILSIILVGHRSLLLALGITTILMFILKKKLSQMVLFIYSLGLLLLIVFIGIEMFTGHSFIEDTLTRGSDTINFENQTSKRRIDKIQNSLYVFSKNPIIGIGYNHKKISYLFSQKLITTNEKDEIQSRKEDVISPHNFALRILTHTGLVGGLLILSIITVVLKKCLKIRQLYDPDKYYGVFLFCSIIYFLIVALMNTTFVTEGWVFWILCGAVAQLSSTSQLSID